MIDPLQIEPWGDAVRPTGPTVKRGKSEQDVATPWEFIHAVEAKFDAPIAWDLAASVLNSKAAIAGLFLGENVDSLKSDWHKLTRPTMDCPLLWLNPPYSNITPWARKCAEERERGAEILLLAPRSGANWYWDWVEPHADVDCVGRMKFVGHEDPYPKDLILAHYHQNSPTRKEQRWRWK